MSIVNDLSLVVREPLVLKFSEENTFTIPVDPTLELTYKMVDFQDKAKNAETEKEQIDLLLDMVILILNQDESKDIDKEFLFKNKISMSQLQAVVQLYQDQILKNNNNPN
ncbi:hypothetical protein [Oceanobacillus massiliensis]|uniref:hypothetical protein n=1 Tax=Oceanobacillus massiliensis TaxID=1465765 RepID=UPI003019E79F